MPDLTDDRATRLFFDLFSGLPRQGPGDPASTVRALALVPGVGPHTRILDLGCGTGLHARVLARHSPAHILSVDNHVPFVDELNRHAERLGLADRLQARVGDMRDLRALDFLPRSFDVIWSEGSIFIVGFETGLREWRQWLAPGGHVAVTEACWTRAEVPAACAAFWAEEYPAIRRIPELLEAVDACGYDTVGHFTLPPASWWDDYYRPLEGNVRGFRQRHPDEPDALAIADRVQREIDVWREYSDSYSYEFIVMRAR
jgi:SAM-dependent methyltransferase